MRSADRVAGTASKPSSKKDDAQRRRPFADRAHPGAAEPLSAVTAGLPNLLSLQRSAGNAATCDLLNRRDASRSAPMRTPAGAVVQRRSSDKQLATVVDAGVVAADATGASGQLGHSMDVWVLIDAGKNPVTPPDARPNTVYGLEMEYWEWVDQTDDQGPTAVKPWNDIYGIKPDARTFDVDAPAAGATLTWKKAVDAAAAGTLRGQVKVGFRDYPGLFARANRNAERTLKFRIVFNDGETRKEIMATQLLRLRNGELAYSAYTDSTGNHIEAAGYGTTTATTDPLDQAIAGEANRLTAAAAPTKQSILGTLPRPALTALHGFLTDVTTKQAAPFVDTEMSEFVKKISKDRQQGAAGDWLTRVSDYFRKDVSEGVAAGQFLMPQMPGAKRYQLAVPGGLLCAVADGRSAPRVYYTDNATTPVSTDVVQGLEDKHWTIPLRSFTEVPTEMVRQSIGTGVVPVPPKDATLAGDEAAHLRRYRVQGGRYIVDTGKTVGPKLKSGSGIKLAQPEVRDITGEWVKASLGTADGFVRVSKVKGLAASVAPTPLTAGAQDAADAMGAVVDKDLTDNGEGEATYTALINAYPGFEAKIKSAYQNKFGNGSLKKAVALDAAERAVSLERMCFSVFAALYDGDHPGMIGAVMPLMRNAPGKGDHFEVAYNDEITRAGTDVPRTLGELVSAYFEGEFRASGQAAVWTRLSTEYPDFAYRLKPAYRLVRGDDALVAMLGRIEKRQLKADVPNPNSRANKKALKAFKEHAPFTEADFVPQAGGAPSTGKFDARFDPATNELVISCRVFYRFNDSTNLGVAKGPEDAGLGDELATNVWKDSEKQDWKQRYETTAVGVWNSSGRGINCIKPGWEGIQVRPRFEIQEVDKDSDKQFLVLAVKSQLAVKDGNRTVKAGSTAAGPGTLMINQHDVYEKINDPRLHGYLHQTEKTGNIEPAYLLDRQRLEGVLTRFGHIPAGTTAQVGVAVRTLADNLKRLSLPSSLATLHPIKVKGTMTSLREASKMAREVKRLLTDAGVGNDILVGGARGTDDGVTVDALPIDPAVKQVYVDSWERYTAAHEFGHMIGLIDEYYSKTSDETVKEMISAGWLPPETRTDHFKTTKLNDEIGKEAEGQAKLMETLRRTGLESPDFADFTNSSPKTTSLMTGGYDVLPVHMVTAWEVLVKMTTGQVDEKYWKIV